MNRIFKIYASILMLCLFSACKLTKDINAPIEQLPATYRNTLQDDTTSIGMIQWKNFFADESLQQLIDSAIDKNYDMQLALKSIESASLLVKQSKKGYLPIAGLNLGAVINRPSDNSLNGLSLSQFLGKSYIEDYNLNATVSWEADIWGKIKNKKKQAIASYLQTNEVKKLIQTNLVAGVANNYYDLLMLDEQLAIAKKNLLLNDSTLQIIQLQYEAGQVTILAVQQATAQRLVAAQLIPLLQEDINVRENAVSILAAVLPATVKRSIAGEQSIFPDQLSAGLPVILVSNRPDVKQYELALDIANASVGIAKANMYPTLSLSASTGINSFKLSNWFNIPASLFGMAAGGITQPLFQRRELKTAFQLSKIERDKTVIRFRQAVLVAVGEVSDALIKTAKVKEQQALAITRVNTLQKAIINADLLFRNGMATSLEVITAQSNILQGELELASLKNEKLHQVIELYRALGGGWK